MAIDCAGVNASGSGTSHSPGTRARSANPPRWVSPTPQPLRTTASPAAMPSWDESDTVPTKSIPGIIGQRRTTGDAPVRARPSL